ncbi:MAG TPA: hypothetical protein VGD81_21320 [Opitutaceae bacterium]
MNIHPLPRRRFVRTTAQLVAGGALAAFSAPRALSQPEPPKAPPKPPALPSEKVKAIVGHSHRSLDAVKVLIAEDPLLANACWDWGGGDFETPLQAAAHTGRREIAEFLLKQNARLDLYAAGMLGMLDLVKAAVAATPQLARVPGPHGFTLLHCVKQGGPAAQPLYDWLMGQGVPEVFQRPLPFKAALTPTD